MIELRNVLSRVVIALSFALACACVSALAQQQPSKPDKPFRGGINQVKDPDRPRPVRNDVAQPGEEVVTSATFLIDAESNLKAALKGFSDAGARP